MKGEQLLEIKQIPANGNPGFSDLCVFKNFSQDRRAVESIQLEKINSVTSGDLHQAGRMRRTFAEGRASFGVEADDAFVVNRLGSRREVGFSGANVQRTGLPGNRQLH